MVAESNMDEFPPGQAEVRCAICSNAMSWPMETPDFLDVEMEHVTRR